MADIDRVQLLIGLSNNMRTDNDAWRKEVNSEGLQRYKAAMQMRTLFEQEYASIDAECRRLEVYAPTPPDRRVQQLPPEQPIPQVAQKGPRQ